MREEGSYSVIATIGNELRRHSPFTLLGTLSGVVLMTALVVGHVPVSWSRSLFWGLHPVHVLLSALVTASMLRLHRQAGWLLTLTVGYVGSIGIATLSDCVIPYVGEVLLGLPNRGIHLGFIEKWWLVNPLALLGIVIGYLWPHTKLPHAGHVWLSTWASLFHMTMAASSGLSVVSFIAIPFFLFLAVWIPCCTSDIVFPLLFIEKHSHEDIS